MDLTITTNTSVTITVNGTAYTFDSPHPIQDLIDQLNSEQANLALWNQRASDSQANISNLNAQIAALCTNPTQS